jgi:hypothetical protein
MRQRCTMMILVGLLGINASWATESQPSPYAGQQERPIKALSEQEVADYLAGKGMGFAKAAELNHYPGPAHVLELAEKLALSPEQRANTQSLFETMHTNAVALGSQLVAAEGRLDELFASRQITPERLRHSLDTIATLQAKVRATHLQAHLAQAEILSGEQLRRYDELRGYGSDEPAHQHSHDAKSVVHP